MLAEELGLVCARRFELLVEAVELVVHPVDVRSEGAELVPVRDLDVPGEVTRRGRGEPRVDALDRSDERPREDEPEEQREDDRPQGCRR
jgi:hypothetical protein